ncbi:MAG TPA: F0F1 ATP synthase subunit B [Candidatus Acetatifactor stercoripullorum]|uniref:ATP synthase subunit b n=1 Tax=Candidatus Acetatifactor stercoripullorum TaxID=2838414 RepID=A0A9D1UBF3_9FIRM|nr:F0F1 ATP synthase subunit B [Candidatus Acetatifactor stercoripullorum]HIW81689.1 F0F1 ATP synthase subunit B [Candidatus Acetatifactor stercoripullorum]
MERLFDLDWQLLADSCLSIIAVFFLFLALSYLLFNPARKMLNNRKEKIKGELDEAQRSMEDAGRLKAEYEERLKNIDREAEEILSSARKKALANESQILSQAKEEAARILERARMEAELEKQKMADNMKKEMISIASLMAGKVVSATVDTAVQNRLIEETLQEIGESTWQS